MKVTDTNTATAARDRKRPSKRDLQRCQAALGMAAPGGWHGDWPESISVLYDRLPTLDEPDRADPGEPNTEGKSDHKPGSRPLINLTVYHLTDTRYKTGWHTEDPRPHDPGRVATIHRFGVLPTLVWWTSRIRTSMRHRGVTPPQFTEVATVRSETSWLAGAMPYILARGWAVVFVRDILATHTRLLEAVTGHKTPRLHCGTCNADLIEAEESDNQDNQTGEFTYWVCPRCGKAYQPGATDLGRRQPPMTGRETAAILGVTWSTFRGWTNRDGILKPVAKDSKGHQLYDLADAKRVRDRTHTRPSHEHNA